jgi:hypothetical protein
MKRHLAHNDRRINSTRLLPLGPIEWTGPHEHVSPLNGQVHTNTSRH